LHREIVAIFWRNDIRAVLSFQYLLRTIFHQLIEAFDLDGNEDLGFGFRSGDMEGYTIEIRHSLVDIDRRGTGYDAIRGVKCGKKVWRLTLKIVQLEQTESERSGSQAGALWALSNVLLFPLEGSKAYRWLKADVELVRGVV
jgi:hypothetical protein